MSESKWSQVQAIGETAPKSWDDYERGSLLTFRGGHHEEPELYAFQHGMSTVFNLLRDEFPPAQLCKAAPDLLAACEAAMRIEQLWGPPEPCEPEHTDEMAALAAMRDKITAAIAKAKGS